jgi:replication factor C small subunit
VTDVSNLIWVEKYRPKTLSDCILPIDLTTIFNGMVKEGKMPNMMFYGKAGTGKTTVARALAQDLGMDSMLINCSEDNGIDTLRVKIRQYASTLSLSGNGKLIILDEFDYATQAIQTGLRGAIEEFAENCRFILTCNYKNRVIDPLHSRCTGVDFTIPSQEKAQKYSSSGKIDIGILSQGSSESYKELIAYMKAKDFACCRKWIVQNIDLNTADFFKRLYNEMYTSLKPNSVPQAILIIAEYQYKSSFAADQEINTMAMVVQLMMDCEFS